MPASNAMFNMMLDVILPMPSGTSIIKTPWIEHDSIDSIVVFNTNGTRYCFGLTTEQANILAEVSVIPADASLYWQKVVACTSALEINGLTEAEKLHPFVCHFTLNENSESTEISEVTSRFSGATWFEEIQKKVIILAGLGGIGSYVCFLLARMHPTSIFLYDDDIVESGNMSGQLYGRNDIGNHKSDAISNMVSNYADYNSIFASTQRFTMECEAHDIMICGFDNMEARRVFFTRWRDHITSKDPEDRHNCLFIDGRLSAEVLQVYCFTGDDRASQDKYINDCLFDDSQADETVCSYKQTTYMANMIGSIIVNLFTNFVANEVAGAPIRELPFFTSYDGYSMQLKIE
jgi:molybdopterin/thiamine biosynthesis adenylyltransferase